MVFERTYPFTGTDGATGRLLRELRTAMPSDSLTRPS